MKLHHFETHLKTKSLRSVLESKPLAQLGDFLANFMYTEMKIVYFNISGSAHVWDKSLRDAMELADLRKYLGKKTNPDRVADAAEAIIAFAYYHSVFTLKEGVNLLTEKVTQSNFDSDKKEKVACSEAFAYLLSELISRTDEKVRFNELRGLD